MKVWFISEYYTHEGEVSLFAFNEEIALEVRRWLWECGKDYHYNSMVNYVTISDRPTALAFKMRFC